MRLELANGNVCTHSGWKSVQLWELSIKKDAHFLKEDCDNELSLSLSMVNITSNLI